MGVTLRSVALPTEHGGWSLTLEPVALGLIVQPSWTGAALGATALAGFVARTPLRIALVDRYRGRRLERTVLAERVAVVLLALIVLLLVAASLSATRAFWVPLVLAAPLLVLELWYDVRSRSRRLVPELAGTIGIASVAAAIGLAGGADSPVAAGLWTVAAARGVAAIPFVRLQLRRAKQQPHHVLTSDLAQLAAVVGTALGLAADAVPPAGLIAIAGLAIVHVVLSRLPVPGVPVIGAQQVVLGLSVVLTAALGFRAP